MNGEAEPDFGSTGSRSLSRLAHGLRTPLALIVGYAELLENRRDEETLSEAPKRIGEAAAELTRIVDDLLTVYAIDMEILLVVPVPIALGSALDQAVAQAEERGSEVSVRVDDEGRSAEVLADPEYAAPMIATLLENARNRRPDTPVTVDARRENDFALIEVCDQAGPVADDDRAAAFERFSPLEPPGGRTTGLELYKVRRLAELQGGRVWLENGTSGEVRFGFALPLARGGGKG